MIESHDAKFGPLKAEYYFQGGYSKDEDDPNTIDEWWDDWEAGVGVKLPFNYSFGLSFGQDYCCKWKLRLEFFDIPGIQISLFGYTFYLGFTKHYA